MIPLLAITSYDAWVMTAGVLCNVACALLGCYLVLRKMSLLGDAITHAVLPGLALAFIITNSRHIVPMLIGALIVGILTTYLTQLLSQWGKVPQDSSMGIVFTTLFAMGVLMITAVANQVDLDPGCVLYGDIGSAPEEQVRLFGREWPIPRQVAMLAGVCLVNILAVLLFYKELKIVSFDPFLAATMGVPVTLVHYGLMTLVAGTSVAAFESVGSILVVAMLIAPPAAAYLLTDRLSIMLILAAIIGAASAIAGYLVSAYVLDSPPAAMMAVFAGLFFGVSLFFAPRHGVLSKHLTRAALTIRIMREDILGMLFRLAESRTAIALPRRNIVEAVGGGLLPRIALRSLQRKGRVVAAADGLMLSSTGTQEARGLVRAHRLWEAYLSKHFGLPLDHLHAPAERMEHYVGPQLQSEIEKEIAPAADPHGRQIPPEGA